MTLVAIGLGSNVGDRFDHLMRAFEELQWVGEVRATSSLYETAPIGGPDQDDFLNAVALVDTELEPRAVLDALLTIERSHGRVRRERWGPRTLDLDLLVHEGHTVDEAGLRVPHPRILERRFVLEPLSEVWPDAPIAPGITARDAMQRVLDQDVVRFTREERNPADDVTVAPWQVLVVTMALALAIWWLLDTVL